MGSVREGVLWKMDALFLRERDQSRASPFRHKIRPLPAMDRRRGDFRSVGNSRVTAELIEDVFDRLHDACI